MELNHYSVATTDVVIQAQLDSGLRLPVESELSTRIQRQSVWFGETLDSLLDEILGDSQATIEGQDHAKLSLNKSTLTKTYREVRIRFNIPLADRGCPWNCLEFRDQLSGFKGPLSLRQGGKLLHWQMTDPEDKRGNRYTYTPVEVSKVVDQCGYWFQKSILDLQLMLMLGLLLGFLVLLAKKRSGSETHWLRISKSGKTLILIMIIVFLRNRGQESTCILDLCCK